jgi:hypothetical protein
LKLFDRFNRDGTSRALCHSLHFALIGFRGSEVEWRPLSPLGSAEKVRPKLHPFLSFFSFRTFEVKNLFFSVMTIERDSMRLISMGFAMSRGTVPLIQNSNSCLYGECTLVVWASTGGARTGPINSSSKIA